jgi:predicted type IV restriction endonuclease
MTADLFDDFDFTQLDSPDFKEDSVRELIVSPLLVALGYANKDGVGIIRSKTLPDPYVVIGSSKRPIHVVPDYLLLVDDNYAWVLDAKALGENVLAGTNVEQAYSYAIHPDIRVQYYALCNGREFVLFRIGARETELYVQLSELRKHWQELSRRLSPVAFWAKRGNATNFL